MAVNVPRISTPAHSGLISSSHEIKENFSRSSVVEEENAQPDSLSPKRSLWRAPFILILGVALTAIIIVSAVVGGGLGASLAHCKSDLSHARSVNPAFTNGTPTTGGPPLATTTGGLFINYAPQPTNTVETLYDNCTLLTKSPYITQFDDKFSVYCGIDINAGRNAVEKDHSGNVLSLADIVPIVAYTPEACMQACSSFNKMALRWGRDEVCRSITFNYEMALTVNVNGANCWLKNGTIPAPAQAEGCDSCLSAFLD